MVIKWADEEESGDGLVNEAGIWSPWAVEQF